jgi:hypothetical protein
MQFLPVDLLHKSIDYLQPITSDIFIFQQVNHQWSLYFHSSRYWQHHRILTLQHPRSSYFSFLLSIPENNHWSEFLQHVRHWNLNSVWISAEWINFIVQHISVIHSLHIHSFHLCKEFRFQPSVLISLKELHIQADSDFSNGLPNLTGLEFPFLTLFHCTGSKYSVMGMRIAVLFLKCINQKTLKCLTLNVSFIYAEEEEELYDLMGNFKLLTVLKLINTEYSINSIQRRFISNHPMQSVPLRELSLDNSEHCDMNPLQYTILSLHFNHLLILDVIQVAGMCKLIRQMCNSGAVFAMLKELKFYVQADNEHDNLLIPWTRTFPVIQSLTLKTTRIIKRPTDVFTRVERMITCWSKTLQELTMITKSCRLLNMMWISMSVIQNLQVFRWTRTMPGSNITIAKHPTEPEQISKDFQSFLYSHCHTLQLCELDLRDIQMENTIQQQLKIAHSRYYNLCFRLITQTK